MPNTETERERRDRKRDAVAREMTRMRAADGEDEPATEEHDLIDSVHAEQQREGDRQDD